MSEWTPEYPSEEDLKKISEWPYADYHGLMEFIHGLWAFDAWGFTREEDIYYISTGGWSGNEDVIWAVKENHMFWALYWQQSKRGGHYIFAPLTMATMEKLEA